MCAVSWQNLYAMSNVCCRFGSELAVIGNTGSNSTREAVHATEQGFAVRAAGCRPAADHMVVRSRIWD